MNGWEVLANILGFIGIWFVLDSEQKKLELIEEAMRTDNRPALRLLGQTEEIDDN